MKGGKEGREGCLKPFLKVLELQHKLMELQRCLRMQCLLLKHEDQNLDPWRAQKKPGKMMAPCNSTALDAEPETLAIQSSQNQQGPGSTRGGGRFSMSTQAYTGTHTQMQAFMWTHLYTHTCHMHVHMQKKICHLIHPTVESL